MKRRTNRYKRGTGIQYLLSVLIAGLCVLVIFKGIHITSKVRLVNEGISLYDKDQWIEAESTLQTAKTYGWFRYKEKNVIDKLDQLDWITQYHTTFKELYDSIQMAEANKDYSTFTQNKETYESLGFHYLEEWQQEYLLEKYPIETAINSSWLTFKVYMQGILSVPNEKSEYNWAKEKIFDIPETYFTGDKEKAIEALFITCDTRVYEYLINHSNSLDTTLRAFNEIYDTNNELGYDTYWLTDKIKAYIKEIIGKNIEALDEETLRQIRNNPQNNEEENTISMVLTQTNNQITNLIKDIKAYRTYANSAYYDESIEKMVVQYLENKEREIEILVKAKYFDEAISWYEHLEGLKNYKEQIKVLRNMKIFEYPELIIGSKINDYPFYQVGENGLGADKYLIAFNTTSSRLEIYGLEGSAEEYALTSVEDSLLELGLDGMDYSALEDISVSGNLILVRVPDKEQQTVQVVKVEKKSIIAIFRISGEEVTVSSDLETLTVKNPKDEEIHDTYSYQYDGESYIKQEVQAIEVGLDNPDIPQMVGQVIAFDCYVPYDAESTVAEGYNLIGNEYFLDQGADLYFEEGQFISEGEYRIVGEVVGEATYYIEDLDREVVRPRIKVIQLERK